MGILDGLLGQPGVQATGGGIVYDPTKDYKETRFDQEGNAYQSSPDAPLIPGHTKQGAEPMFQTQNFEMPPVQSVHDYGANYYSGKPFTPQVTRPPEPKIDPMSLYNRQGRADYTPQNIVSDEVVMGKPPLGYYPNASERAEAEERWYQEQDKIEATYQALLKAQGIEQKQLEAENNRILDQAQQDEFNQRVQDRLQHTPDWLGQASGPISDTQREDLNRYTDTDYFGNPLDSDAFGETHYDTNLNRKLDSMNRLAFSGGEQTPVQPTQPSNTTDFFNDRARASKKYQDAVLNIGDTISEGASSLYEGAKDLGSNIDLGGVGESISNIWGDLTTDKPEMPVVQPTKSADEIDVFEVLGETDELVKPKQEPTFSDDWVGRNQETTYKTRKALAEAMGVGEDIVDKVMPIIGNTTPAILLNPEHPKHQEAKDLFRNLARGAAQGFLHDLPQGVVDFGVDAINLGANKLGYNDVIDTDKSSKLLSGIGYTEEQQKEFEDSTAYNLSKFGSQLGGGYLGLAKIMGNANTANKFARVLKESIALSAPGLTLDVTEGNISDMINTTEYKNAVTEMMGSQVGDDASAEDRFVARLKNSGEELFLGMSIPALYGLAKATKSALTDPQAMTKFMDNMPGLQAPIEKSMAQFDSERGLQPNLIQAERNAQQRLQTQEIDKQELQGVLDNVVDTGIDTDTRQALNQAKADAKAKAQIEREQQELSKPQAPTDELGFYSKAEQVLMDLKQEKNLPSDILAYLRKKGVTQNELEDTGLLKMLTKKKESGERVTKTGLLDHISENKVKLSEEQHFGASEDDMLDNLSDFELQDPSIEWNTEDTANFNILDDEENYQHIIDDFLWDDDNGVVLTNKLHELFPDKYPLTKNMEYDKLTKEMGELNSGDLDDSYVEKRKPIVKARLQELSDMKDEDFYGEWDIKLLEEINEKGVDGISESSMIQDVINSLSKEQYLKSPYYEWNTRSGYTATGSEDTGIIIKDPDGNPINMDDPAYSISEANIQINQHSIDYGHQAFGGDTLYSSYTQPGLTDKSTYREIPIMGKLEGQKDFTGAHMNEDNVVAWLRASDRVDADGKHVLFIEEVQSDWHQQGRKRGYNKTTQAQAKEIQRKINVIENNYIRNAEIDGNTELVEKFKDEVAQLRGQLADMDYNVPNAPLKNEKWQEMAVDRAMKIASEEGYDRVVFANANQQLDNWNPGRNLNEKGKIRYEELYTNIYDRNIPSFVNKYAKKYGTTTGKTELDFDGDSVGLNYIDVTPKDFKKNIERTPLPATAAIPTGGLLMQEESQSEEMKDGILNNVKSWKPSDNLINFVKMMENAPLAVGNVGVTEYDDVGHQAKGYGTKSGLLAQDTEEEASKAMIKKLIEFNKDVDRLVKIKLNKDERNALVSLLYNIGDGNFAKSKALKALNKGDKKTFLKEAFDPKIGFVKSDGKVLKGLVNRRAREKQIFTKGNYGN